MQFQSADTSNGFTILEVNLSETGTKVFAGATGALVYHGTTLRTSIPLTSRGGNCDSGGVGQVTLDGTLTNQQSAAEKITFTLTETGVLGSATITATGSTNGSTISDGTYSIPAACGFPADHGTFTGYKDSLALGSTPYSGTFNGGADAIVATVVLKVNTFDLTMSGTDNGTNFVLTGSRIGFSLAVAGNVGGKAVNWFGLYDPIYNVIVIYDPNDHLVGTLSGVGSPWDYSRAPHSS